MNVGTVKVDVQKLVSEHTIQVRIKHLWRYRLRSRIGFLVMRLGAWIVGVGLVAEPERALTPEDFECYRHTGYDEKMDGVTISVKGGGASRFVPICKESFE